jgi:hypothetical protein
VDEPEEDVEDHEGQHDVGFHERADDVAAVDEQREQGQGDEPDQGNPQQEASAEGTEGHLAQTRKHE